MTAPKPLPVYLNILVVLPRRGRVKLDLQMNEMRCPDAGVAKFGESGISPNPLRYHRRGERMHPVSVSFFNSRDLQLKKFSLLWGRKVEAREKGEGRQIRNVVVDQKRDLPALFSVIGRGSRILNVTFQTPNPTTAIS